MDTTANFAARWPIKLVIVSVCSLAALGNPGGDALANQELVAPEYKVKAAFLYNFAKLVEWPATALPAAQSNLVIGVLGVDPFGSQLDTTLKDKKIEDRSLVVHRFQRPNEVTGCHILFISASEKADIRALLTSLQGKSILTVGETDQFAAQGGMIQLLKQHDAIRFAINTNSTANAQLKLSSKLLRLATELFSGRPNGGH